MKMGGDENDADENSLLLSIYPNDTCRIYFDNYLDVNAYVFIITSHDAIR